MKYPLGIQNFQNIREEGYLYVDKTNLIYQIVTTGKYYFLSRPRRFGKSLLISTFEAYFKGKKELFEGLAVSQLETEWKEYSIFHLDLNARNYTDKDALLAELNKHLEIWEAKYGDELKDRAPKERFQRVIINAYKQTNRKVVILVDEYDKPLLQMFDDKPMQEEYRRILKAFFGVMKTMDAYIQFGFITGVTKFSKVSVFSDLNNLTDISMDKRYVDICGITEQEIKAGLDAEVEAMAEENGISKAECYDKLRQSYDGYHFESETTGIYNPYSLLSALSSRAFKDYWFATATPSYLIERLQHSNYPLDSLGKEELTADVLGDIDTIDQSPVPILYQSGYLTLKGYNKEFEMYRLGFPNHEVERAFTRCLIPYYTNQKSD